MKSYNLKDTTPYKKLKEEYIVFELSSEQEFQQAILDNETGELFIEDTKAYILTPSKKCFVIFYDDKNKISKILTECWNGGNNYGNNRRDINK